MYNPTVWHSGDVIKSEKLNHIEQGIKDIYDIFVFSESEDEDDDDKKDSENM